MKTCGYRNVILVDAEFCRDAELIAFYDKGIEGMGLEGLVQIPVSDFHGEGAFRIFEISGYDDSTVVGGDEDD